MRADETGSAGDQDADGGCCCGFIYMHPMLNACCNCLFLMAR
jgi:hypothetical protein